MHFSPKNVLLAVFGLIQISCGQAQSDRSYQLASQPALLEDDWQIRQIGSFPPSAILRRTPDGGLLAMLQPNSYTIEDQWYNGGLLIKLDSTGRRSFTQKVAQFTGIEVDPVSGDIALSQSADGAISLTVLDASGAQRFSRNFPNVIVQNARYPKYTSVAIAFDGAGGYYIGGDYFGTLEVNGQKFVSAEGVWCSGEIRFSNPAGCDGGDFYMMHLGAYGEVLWATAFGGASDQELLLLRSTPSGVRLVGKTGHVPGTYPNAPTLRMTDGHVEHFEDQTTLIMDFPRYFDASKDQPALRTVFAGGQVRAMAPTKQDDGSFLFNGTKFLSGSNQIVRIGADGVASFVVDLSSGNRKFVDSILERENGTLAILGYGHFDPNNSYTYENFVLGEWSPSGKNLWMHHVRDGVRRISNLVETDNGSLGVMVARTSPDNMQIHDIFFQRFTPTETEGN